MTGDARQAFGYIAHIVGENARFIGGSACLGRWTVNVVDMRVWICLCGPREALIKSKSRRQACSWKEEGN